LCTLSECERQCGGIPGQPRSPGSVPGSQPPLVIALYKCAPPSVFTHPSCQRRLPLMVVSLDSAQVAYDPPTEYPDDEQDKPIDGPPLVAHQPHDLNRSE
jgi:hypothetical protein